MAHKNMVDGTVYDTSGGKTMVSGTAYSVESGKTMIGGTVWEIVLRARLKVVITGSGSSGDLYAIIGSKKYYTETELRFDSLETIYLYAKVASGGSSIIVVNGKTVASGNSFSPATYELAVPEDAKCITINLREDATPNTVRIITVTTE